MYLSVYDFPAPLLAVEGPLHPNALNPLGPQHQLRVPLAMAQGDVTAALALGEVSKGQQQQQEKRQGHGQFPRSFQRLELRQLMLGIHIV